MSRATEQQRLAVRLRELEWLRTRVAAEILNTRRMLAAAGRIRHPRNVRPACGTERGYQWHRYHDPDNWPLPADDPCGCRAAHAKHNRIRHAVRRQEADT